MKYFKALRKFTIRLLKIVFLAVVGYLVVAAICAVIIINDETVIGAPRTHKLFLVSNGVHISFALPTKTDIADWSAMLQRPDLADMPYTYIGWGSESFYTQVPTWSDLTLKLSVKALFLDKSVLFIQGGYTPQTHHREIAVTSAQLQQLTDDITAQMVSRTPLLHAPYFYRGKGHYSPLTTCNEWVRRRLAKIGVATPIWSPFDRPILWALPERN